MTRTSAGGVPTCQELNMLRERLSSAELGQSHLFKGWPSSAEEFTEEQRCRMLELFRFGDHYRGGVEQYVRNGQRLLSATDNGLQEYTALDNPSYVYEAPSLFDRSEELMRLEREGLSHVKQSVFVLVAGGLGERLGYSGIKLGLPVETASRRCYLEHYLAWVNHAAGPNAPFVIMTSDDTHARTEELLQALGRKTPNVHLLKQETVFCFTDTAAHLAVENGKLLRKPHGHGDVHSLLYNAVDRASGRRLLELWQSQGYSYIVFLQDTNAIATLTIPVSLAISARNHLAMNFTCIPRQPKEAIGLLCKVRMRGSDVERTVNIEYNNFASVAASLTELGGDTAVPGSIYSPYPGSINTLILDIKEYLPKLIESHGRVPEFINIKFIDETKTKFKPCRIESLMQDVALLFDSSKTRVGGVTFSRFTYQPVKNALQEGIKKASEGLAAYCAATGEEEYYEALRLRFQAVGLKLPAHPNDDCVVEVESVLKLQLFPIIVADAVAMGSSLEEITQGLLPHPDKVTVSSRSVLLVEGRVRIESLDLDGALHLVGPTEKDAPPLVINALTVKNAGWVARVLSVDEEIDEIHRVRGFVLEEKEMKTIHYATL
ncbi:UDP-sugar pyrophosphorylase [Trypanosoma rangeli]|uniref:UTP-monosaccharide-1-phosphate uridylyltransferase n=1 Tax=Trypanosoma rangeli TaxID=5698 RepID=A0A3R7KRK2_TRYRA|nr:UDP-sugar pyrophosphorylase [Trypanosoma rangeli]RNF08297.1 UDP-sugar pyrophosphorylase [Trypanosoma rangeli]|eukprot:RNF08297.1 UDP-sugar pyrophosphorylase [Trypanosoma rangeli]